MRDTSGSSRSKTADGGGEPARLVTQARLAEHSDRMDRLTGNSDQDRFNSYSRIGAGLWKLGTEESCRLRDHKPKVVKVSQLVLSGRAFDDEHT